MASRLIRAGVVAEHLAAQIVATDAVERCSPFVDMERRLELSDLLAHETDAFQLQDPLNLEGHAVGPAAHVLELALDVLDRDRRPDRVVDEETLVFFHRHQARSRLSPDQPISRSPRARNGPPPSSRRANWAIERWHLLAQIEVEADFLDPGVLHAEVELAASSEGGRFPRENFTGDPRKLKFTWFMVTSPLSKSNWPWTSSIGSSKVPPGSIPGWGERVITKRRSSRGEA